MQKHIEQKMEYEIECRANVKIPRVPILGFLKYYASL